MNKQTAIDILENLDLSNITADVPFWWNDAQEALKELLSLVEGIEELENRAYDAERDLDYANDELYDAKGEIKDLQEEIENLNKITDEQADEISRLENIIAELERGGAV